MRVLHVIDHLGLGGAQRIVLTHMKYSDEPNMHLFALRRSHAQPKLVDKRIEVFDSTATYSFRALKQLIQKIKQNNYTIVHTHLQKSLVFGIICKVFFPHITFIYHEHGNILNNKTGYTLLLRFSAQFYQGYIAVSKLIKSKLSSIIGSSNKIYVLYNFISPEFTDNADKHKLNKKHAGFTVGYAGRIKQNKGWAEFVTAVKLAHKKDSTIKALIAGDGKERDLLIKNIEQHDYITYLKTIHDMQSFYTRLDCFVMSSRMEAMGLTQLEAQAMGVPVIATNIPAMQETLSDGENAILVPVKNPQAIGDAMLKLLKDVSLRKKLIRNGKNNVKRYNYTNWNQELDQVYSKCA